MKILTDRQEKVLEFVTEYTKSHGYPPTVREIGEHFRILWAAARGHLQALQKKGFIRLIRSRSRGIEIPGLRPADGIPVPIAGTIRAGEPILAREDAGSNIMIDRGLFPYPDAFSLRITGDSMQDAGILEGDYVVIKPQNTIDSGEIGVVLIEDEATVKRIFRKHGKIILKPENETMEPTAHRPDDVAVIGKVVGVIRKM